MKLQDNEKERGASVAQHSPLVASKGCCRVWALREQRRERNNGKQSGSRVATKVMLYPVKLQPFFLKYSWKETQIFVSTFKHSIITCPDTTDSQCRVQEKAVS